MTEAKHGTRSGYVSHFKTWHTPTCAACRDAHNRHMQVVMAAQRAAIRRLKDIHPATWIRLYAEEKARRGI